MATALPIADKATLDAVKALIGSSSDPPGDSTLFAKITKNSSGGIGIYGGLGTGAASTIEVFGSGSFLGAMAGTYTKDGTHSCDIKIYIDDVLIHRTGFSYTPSVYTGCSASICIPDLILPGGSNSTYNTTGGSAIYVSPNKPIGIYAIDGKSKHTLIPLPLKFNKKLRIEINPVDVGWGYYYALD